jgi:hemolysin III
MPCARLDDYRRMEAASRRNRFSNGFPLILSGGTLYTIGTIFHAWRGLRFQNAVWHAFVLVVAGCHYAAVLRTVRIAG